MKTLLSEYLTYALFFGLLTFFVWKSQKRVSSLTYIGFGLFWASYLIQVIGMMVLYMLPPFYNWEYTLFIITIGGMMTASLMIAHGYIEGNQKHSNQDDADD